MDRPQLRLHPFIANNCDIWQLLKCDLFKGLEKFVQIGDHPRDSQVITGASMDFLLITTALDTLKLPYIDFTMTVLSDTLADKKFSIPSWCDLFLGVCNPELVEMIEIQNNVYPFPGIPRVYTAGIFGKGVKIFTTEPLAKGLDVMCRIHNRDVLNKICQGFLKNRFDPPNMLMYNQGTVTPGYINRHKHFVPLELGDVERYRKRNNDAMKDYAETLSGGNVKVLEEDPLSFV